LQVACIARLRDDPSDGNTRSMDGALARGEGVLMIGAHMGSFEGGT
jgi:predicted LPLAT superfamily acyltransferase